MVGRPSQRQSVAPAAVDLQRGRHPFRVAEHDPPGVMMVPAGARAQQHRAGGAFTGAGRGNGRRVQTGRAAVHAVQAGRPADAAGLVGGAAARPAPQRSVRVRRGRPGAGRRQEQEPGTPAETAVLAAAPARLLLLEQRVSSWGDDQLDRVGGGSRRTVAAVAQHQTAHFLDVDDARPVEPDVAHCQDLVARM